MPVSVMNWRQMRPTPELIAITMIDVGVATLSLNLKKVIQFFFSRTCAFASLENKLANFRIFWRNVYDVKDTVLGMSAGMVVMGGDSCPEVCGFKSQLRILDGLFSHIFVVKIVTFV